MTEKMAPHKNRALTNYIVISSLGLGLALCSFAPALSAQQDQPGDVYAAPMQQDQQNAQDQGGPDQNMQQGPPQQGMRKGLPPQGMRQEPPPQGVQPPPEQAVPSSLTLPAGTVIRVRVNEWLSSDRNVIGDGFSAVLDQPIVVDGWVVARRGQSESGRVSQAQKAGRVSGTSKLGLELTDLTVVDGQQLPVQTQMLQASGGTSHGQDDATIGTTTGLGAAIGAVADGGAGAGIARGAGAAAGILGVLTTRGKPTVIFPESVLTIPARRILSRFRPTVVKNAFQPVTQADYDPRNPGTRPQRAFNTGTPWIWTTTAFALLRIPVRLRSAPTRIPIMDTIPMSRSVLDSTEAMDSVADLAAIEDSGAKFLAGFIVGGPAAAGPPARIDTQSENNPKVFQRNSFPWRA